MYPDPNPETCHPLCCTAPMYTAAQSRLPILPFLSALSSLLLPSPHHLVCELYCLAAPVCNATSAVKAFVAFACRLTAGNRATEPLTEYTHCTRQRRSSTARKAFGSPHCETSRMYPQQVDRVRLISLSLSSTTHHLAARVPPSRTQQRTFPLRSSTGLSKSCARDRCGVAACGKLTYCTERGNE